MATVRGRLQKNPWLIAGLVCTALLFVGLVLFAMQVLGFMRDIKAGKEDPFAKDTFKASVTRLLAQMPVDDIDLGRIAGTGKDPRLGSPNPKIRIVEFLDFQCPYSAEAAPIVRAFLAKHPDDVELVVRDFPLDSLHPDALRAAIAARCVFRYGDADRYWMYHDMLFRHQDALDAESLRTYAEAVGADTEAFDACMAGRVTEVEVRTSMADGLAAGVRGAPTLFVNTVRLPGAPTLEVLEEMIRQLKGV
ncbi:DsbA family protein [Patescibacteria group bacterium]|nr:DsbA family protein [Patescibacteria group bacterium]MBU1448466.1 DsbA family protein [Patescibacteria group bacterium]MBU2613533.1 DsbA family protein [Patescibacteria group bacterium]